MKQSILVLCAALLVGCSEQTALTEATPSEKSVATNELALSKKSNTGESALYNVTITNMTSGQPFSPGVIVTHDPGVALFESGAPASDGIREIAENGNPGPAFAALDGLAGVTDVTATDAPVHRRGGPGASSVTWQVEGSAGDVLSLAVMLICTNDGFAGLNSVELPRGPETAVYFGAAYDAGTEANDELLSSIVDPCNAIGPVALPGDGSNANPVTAGEVTMHPNISGSGDLDPADYAWGTKVAKIKIKRVN